MLIATRKILLSIALVTTAMTSLPDATFASPVRDHWGYYPEKRKSPTGVIAIIGGIAVLGALAGLSGAGGKDKDSGSRDPGDGSGSGDDSGGGANIDFDMDRVVRAAANNPQADVNRLSAIQSADDYLANPALGKANLANRLALGFTGGGVDVGIMDFGIQWDNPNLIGVDRGEGFQVADTSQYGLGSTGTKHGTYVAQVVAGNVGDGDLSRGVAPGVTLHDINFLQPKDGVLYATWADTADAFRYVASEKIDIVNWSMAIYDQSAVTDLEGATMDRMQTVLPGIRAATESGAIIVVAAGNNGLESPDNIYAGAGLFEEVANGQFVVSAALDTNGGKLASFSNACGSTMNYCISAVGERIPVIAANGDLEYANGTSLSAPVVTGSLALLKEQFPELGSRELVELIYLTADDLGDPGIDAVYGRGRLNMNKAFAPVGELRLVQGDQIHAPALSSRDIKLSYSAGMSGVAEAIDGKVVALIDDTNRAFYAPLPALAQQSDPRKDPITEAMVDIRIGRDYEITFAADDGAFVRSRHGYGLGYIEPEIVLDRQNLVMDRGYHPLSIVDRGATLTWSRGRLTAGLAVSGGERDAGAAWLSLRPSSDAVGMAFSAGYIREKDGLMASDFTGGHGDALFGSVSGTIKVADNLDVIWDGSYMKGKYSAGKGLMKSMDANAASTRIGLSYEDRAGGEYLITAGLPLTAYDGDAHFDLPVGRDEAIEGSEQDGVQRERSSSGFSGKFPVDIGLGYRKKTQSGLSIEGRAVRRLSPEGERDETFFGLRMSARF